MDSNILYEHRNADGQLYCETGPAIDCIGDIASSGCDEIPAGTAKNGGDWYVEGDGSSQQKQIIELLFQ